MASGSEIVLVRGGNIW